MALVLDEVSREWQFVGAERGGAAGLTRRGEERFTAGGGYDGAHAYLFNRFNRFNSNIEVQCELRCQVLLSV